MFRYIKYSLFFIVGVLHAQEDIKTIEKPWRVGLHYVGNIRNENVFSASYNGILGVDVSYVFAQTQGVDFRAAIDLHFLSGRDADRTFTRWAVNDMVMLNPTLGASFKLSSKFRPYAHIGVALFKIKSEIPRSSLQLNDPFDPVFTPSTTLEQSKSFHALTLQAGWEWILFSDVQMRMGYTYLPIENNVNGHLLTFGLGYRL